MAFGLGLGFGFGFGLGLGLGLGHRLAHGAAARANDAGVPAQPGLEQAGVLGRSQLEQLVEDRVDAGRLRLAARAARLG